MWSEQKEKPRRKNNRLLLCGFMWLMRDCAAHFSTSSNIKYRNFPNDCFITTLTTSSSKHRSEGKLKVLWSAKRKVHCLLLWEAEGAALQRHVDVNHLHSFCGKLTKKTLCTLLRQSREIYLVILWYCIGQDVAAGAGGDVDVGGATECRGGGCGGGGLLGMLQLLPGHFPLFGASVLKPDLHLGHTNTFINDLDFERLCNKLSD